MAEKNQAKYNYSAFILSVLLKNIRPFIIYNNGKHLLQIGKSNSDKSLPDLEG